MLSSNKKKIILKIKPSNSKPSNSIIPKIDYKNNKEKGDIYEKYIYYHLLETNKYKNVWLWKNVPEYELLKSGIMDNWNNARLMRKRDNLENNLPDFATDLFTLEVDDNDVSNNNKYSIIQCKNYDDSRKLRPEHLGTFYFMMYRYSRFINGLVFHTNELCENLINHSNTNDNIKYNRVNIEENKLELYNLNKLNNINNDENDINDEKNNTILEPFQYQLDAYNALKGKQRTVLQMACGTGKTLVSILLSKDYKQNIIISPLKAYCEQNMERFKSQMSNDYKMLIIDSDNDGRNIAKIKEFIENNDKIYLFVTYKSIDIINQLISYDDNNIKLLNDYFIIIDEFHNISYNDVYEQEDDEEEDDIENHDEEDQENEDLEEDEENEDLEEDEENEDLEEDKDDEEVSRKLEGLKTSQMYNLLHSNSRIMFMSATPKLFGDNLDSPDDIEIDNDIFGNIDYTYSMSSAIDDGRICDYKIFVPTLHIKKEVGIDLIYNEVNLKDYDKELVIKARYVIKGMMEMGSRKCIIYLQSQNECREMTNIINEQCKHYFAITNNCNYIISSDLKNERKDKLNKFINFDGYSFLCSVDILNECIDIPKCDSIFIAYPSKSKIRNIQRLCRANRKDKENPNKIANIFLWCDDYKDDLVDFISHIKEYDSKFTFDKIKRLNVANESKTLMMPEVESEEHKELEGLVVGFRGVGGWMDKWNKLYNKTIEFIKFNNKRPSSESKNIEESYLGKWVCTQTQNFKNKKNCLKNECLYNKWLLLLEMFPYIKIDNDYYWFKMLTLLDEFINKNKALPSKNKFNISEKNLNSWMNINKQHYKYKIFNMKDINNKYYKEWKILKNKHYTLLLTTEDKWYYNYNLLINNFLIHNKKPLFKGNQENESNLAQWIRTQFNNIRLNKDSMLYPERRKLWGELIIKYKKILMTQDEECIDNMINVMTFIDINNRKPSKHCKNNEYELKLGRFIDSIKKNYKTNKGSIFNNTVKPTFELLKNNYCKYIQF
jgi:superfamily II DNA or RNA helicase